MLWISRRYGGNSGLTAIFDLVSLRILLEDAALKIVVVGDHCFFDYFLINAGKNDPAGTNMVNLRLSYLALTKLLDEKHLVEIFRAE